VPLFSGTDLAARVERAELRLIEEGTVAAMRRHPAGGAFALPLAGGLACWAGPESPLDKVVGLGFDGSPSDDELAVVERAYAERATAVRIELASLAEPTIAAQLTRRGYRLESFENVLALPLRADLAGRVAEGVEISECAPTEMALWLELLVTGFAAPDTQGAVTAEEFPRAAMESAMADFASAAGLRRYLAKRDGEPAGGASLRLDDGVAQLCGATTLPAHRRHGVQSSLLAKRLADARAMGCDLAVATTQPGSKSQENMQRQGFELLYVRAVLVR
jgi:ribosomal protein S18 acetylase RimI-like enzyme